MVLSKIIYNIFVFLEATEENNSKVLTSAEEIVGNLPKVWRVLMELLSHQAPPQVIVDEGGKSTSLCYKSVETPSGPRMVPSVSKTYIRLKVKKQIYNNTMLFLTIEIIFTLYFL